MVKKNASNFYFIELVSLAYGVLVLNSSELERELGRDFGQIGKLFSDASGALVKQSSVTFRRPLQQ